MSNNSEISDALTLSRIVSLLTHRRALFWTATALVGLAIAGAAVVPWLFGGNSPAVIGFIYDGYDGDSARALSLVTTPVVLLMFAAGPGFLAEYARRGDFAVKETPGLRGGTVRVVNRGLPTRQHLAVFLVLVALWAVVLVPAAMIGDGIDFTLHRDQQGDYWTAVVLNGFVAAGLAGTVGGSLVKKRIWARYLELRPRPAARGKRERAWWRFFSHRFRLDIWTCAFGAGIIGVSPVLFARGWVLAGSIFILVGVVVTLVGLYLTAQAWRSGKNIYELESLT